MCSKPVSALPGIGPAYQKRLKKLGITTQKELLNHFPSRFLDFSQTLPINQLQLKKTASFKAKIGSPDSFYSKSGKYVTTAAASDATGRITLIWFNSRYIRSLIKPNAAYIIAGTPAFYANKLAIFAPQIERYRDHTPNIHTRGFVPLYPLTQSVSSKWLRAKIHFLLKNSSIPHQEDYFNIHFPSSLKAQDLADQHLSFRQHLKINLKNLKEQAKKPPAVKLTVNQKIHLAGIKKLPFSLTLGQKKALLNSYQDIQSTIPGRRLIYGDTGSGKTAALILLANQSLNSNYSFALLAPTQILAKQHAQTFKKCLSSLKRLGWSPAAVNLNPSAKPISTLVLTPCLINCPQP